AAGDLALAGDADQPAQRGVTVQLRQAVLDGVVAEQDGQKDDGPEARDGVVVAALAAGGAEAVEQLLVGDGLEGVAEGGEGRAVFHRAKGGEGVGGVDEHGAPPWRKEGLYSGGENPPRGRWVKNPEKSRTWPQPVGKTRGVLGEALKRVSATP